MMLFKTRSGLTPQTPKIRSVSLPDDYSSGAGMLSGSSTSMHPSIPRNRGLFDWRPVTPQPVPPERSPSSHARHASLSSTRNRTSSLNPASKSTPAIAPLKSILKSSKAEPSPLPSDAHPVETKDRRQSGEYSRSRFPIDDRGRSDYILAKTIKTSSYDHRNAYFSDSDAIPPKPKLGVTPVHKSPSDPTHTRHRSSSHDRGKEVLVTKSLLKEESIVLSWPLVDYSYRKKRAKIPGPLLYFDVAFDPRIDLNVRIDRGGCSTNISPSEKGIPVSTHCEVTKMKIICQPLASWPIEIRHRNGITCFDVFCAIYDTFHQLLTPEELAIIPKDFFDEKFRKAFRMRCKDSPGLEQYNWNAGPRRVDLLKGRRIFQGIERSGADWELTIDRIGSSYAH